MENYRHLLLAAVQAAVEAGEKIMEIYNHPDTDWEVEYKADHSPLTRADRAAHAAIAERLAATGLPLLSEEGRHDSYDVRRDWMRLWIVDPLDGTKEFLKRNGEFTVNIALVENAVPVAGVIYVPVRRTLYFGLAAEGAWKLSGLPAVMPADFEALTSCAGRLPLGERHEGYVVVASRSHLSAETQSFIDGLRRKHADVQLRSAGSSLKLCLVAEGGGDVYPRMAPTMEWDTAAGDAIVRAAGGRVVQAEGGEPLAYNKEDLHNPWFIVFPNC